MGEPGHYRGLRTTGYAADSDRLGGVLEQAAAGGYDTRMVWVDAAEVIGYAELRAADGIAIEPWHKPLDAHVFMFECAPRRGIERPNDA
jgi:hypothetical protein